MEIGARLHHVELLSPDAGACAGFYGRAYAMHVRQQGSSWICAGPQRKVIVSPGPANTLGFAAYAFPTDAALDAFRRRVEANTPVTAANSPLFQPGAFMVVDPDGNRIAFGVAIDAAGGVSSDASPDESPNEADTPPARLQHFAFRSTEPADVLPFYRDHLGFLVSDCVHDADGRMRACFLRTDPEHHALAIFHASEARHDHLSFETADWGAVREWADRFSRLHVPIVWGVGRHGPGNDTFFMIRDPDGNLAEISAELEVCAPSRAEGRWMHEQRTLNLWGSAIMRA